jgi:hypothetical protein
MRKYDFFCPWVLFIWLIFIPSITGADSYCDTTLIPEDNEFGYGWRQNRCEGFYGDIINVSGSMTIIGATQGQLIFDIHSEQAVIIKSPKLPEEFLSTIRVRAVGVQPEMYYRMDGQLSEGQMVWPVQEVLKPMGVLSRQLGLMAWTEIDSRRVLIPAIVDQGDIESDHSRIILIVRANTKLDVLQYRVAPENGPIPDPFPYENAISQPAYPATGIPVIIPQGPSAILIVEIQARPFRSDRWLEPLFAAVYRSGSK